MPALDSTNLVSGAAMIHVHHANDAAVSVPALDSTNLVSGAAMIHVDHANDADVSVPALDSTNLVSGAAMIHVHHANDAAVSVPAQDSTNLVSGAAMIHIHHSNDAAVSVPALDSTNLVPGAGTIHVLVDHATSTVDPASLVGLKLNLQDKELVIRLGPCEPSKAELIVKKVKCGERYRYCSSLVFNHSDGTKRKWLFYSQKRNALHCLPCLLFTDATLMG